MHILVSGCNGLIGSEAVLYFEGKGYSVTGVDNNLRQEFFGPAGDTLWNLERLKGAPGISSTRTWTFETTPPSTISCA